MHQLDKLCRANQAAILQHFPVWQKVPERIRNDPAAVPHYAQGLIGVARHFAERLRKPELLQRLVGGEQSNPLVQWQNRLAEARHQMDQLRYAEARDLLTNTLIDVRGLSGSGVDSYLPITLGFLSESFFQIGKAEKAIPHEGGAPSAKEVAIWQVTAYLETSTRPIAILARVTWRPGTPIGWRLH